MLRTIKYKVPLCRNVSSTGGNYQSDSNFLQNGKRNIEVQTNKSERQ
jgi:hypothetical protein